MRRHRPGFAGLLLLASAAAAAGPFWSGGVTATSAAIRARPVADVAAVRVFNASGLVYSEVVTPDDFKVELEALAPDTEYWYSLSTEPERGEGRFRTFPAAAGEEPLSLGFSSCAYAGAEDEVFDEIAGRGLAQFVHMGDLHYHDITASDAQTWDEAYGSVFDSASQSRLFRRLPVAYVFDDHDFGGDGTDTWAPNRDAARAAYRRNVPHYALAGGDSGALFQAWTAAGVRVLLTDQRSAADLGADPPTILGAAQKQWLLEELARWADYRAVLWVCGRPWLGARVRGSDNWAHAAAERREISDAIAALGVTNLVVVGGDDHMIAIDDGSHTDFSDLGPAGFPLLQAAPLYQFGSSTSGPYSEGCHAWEFAENNHYGVVDVTGQTAADVCVRLRAFSADGLELELERCAPLVREGRTGAGGTEACAIQLLPWGVWLLTAAATALIGGVVALRCSYGGCGRRRWAGVARALLPLYGLYSPAAPSASPTFSAAIQARRRAPPPGSARRKRLRQEVLKRPAFLRVQFAAIVTALTLAGLAIYTWLIVGGWYKFCLKEVFG